MSIFKIFDRHRDLSARMSNALNVDLAEAAQRGLVSENAEQTLVLSCTACRDTGKCESWLSQNNDGATEAPDFCRNKTLLDRLAGL